MSHISNNLIKNDDILISLNTNESKYEYDDYGTTYIENVIEIGFMIFD
jgi:hypothetical protein